MLWWLVDGLLDGDRRLLGVVVFLVVALITLVVLSG